MPRLIKCLLKKIRMRLMTAFCYRPLWVGREFYCGPGTYIRPGTLSAGHEVSIGRNCRLANNRIVMGSQVMVACNVGMIDTGDHDHHSLDQPMRHAGRGPSKPIVICDNVWIGYGAIILSGVTIGQGAVIGAGSVVTHHIPALGVAAGNPARVIKMRGPVPMQEKGVA